MNDSIDIIELIGLGSLAGALPVYLGIAIALLISQVLDRAWEGFLIGLSTGILVYLFFDLMHEAVEMTSPHDAASWIVFLGSLFVSFIGLVAVEWRQQRKKDAALNPLFLPYMVALGMGLHNLGEGLAIGASYAQGEWVLSGLLVGGFALHNGTEGFGIVGPMGRKMPRVKDIFLLGLLAGGPTILGTVVSAHGVSSYLSVSFYTLAAGSLLYVIVSLIAHAYTAERRLQTATGLFVGICAMYLSGMVLTLMIGTHT